MSTGVEVSGQRSEAMPRPPLPQPQMASSMASRLPPLVPFISLPDLCRLFSTDQTPRGVFIKHKSQISLFYLKLSCNLLTKRCISTTRPVLSAPLVSGLVSCTLYLTHVSAHKLALIWQHIFRPCFHFAPLLSVPQLRASAAQQWEGDPDISC